MKKVSLLFGIHMHQPVDNFGDAVDEAIELCYGPFFETMVEYPDFKFAVHCSGWLLDEIRQKHPKIFKNMKKLTKKGAIEWISAGYYEPVLSAIPSRDRQGQVAKLNNYLKEHLDAKPQGLWLTERVWEASIVPDIEKVGIKYAIVDDYHFLSSGYDAHKMDGYYTTEEGGDKLALFPISQSLRYALPFFKVERAIEAILNCSKEKDSAAIIFDDAEKFGLWPKTHSWVYEEKWLKKFVEAVLSHEKIETKHYSKYLKQNDSRGLAYLNNTSYFEMGEWSLKAEQTLALEALKEKVGDDYFNDVGVTLIKGGIWKNFFVKYHESNYLHKRMLSFSKKQDSFDEATLESFYRLQTNDVFWHGVFGGLYLPNLRDNAYKYLLEIEKSRAKGKISYEYEDINMDGFKELKVLSKSLSTVFSSRWGAQMVELGSLETLFNWQNTLMRRKEAYHEKILTHVNTGIEMLSSEDEIDTIHSSMDDIDEKLKDQLIYDWHPKHSFVDHFSPAPFELGSFKHVTFHEVGDFANHNFELDESSNTFTRKGGIYLDKKYKTEVKKAYSFDDNSVNLDLTCQSEYDKKLFYGVEFNFHFAHPHHTLINGQKVEDGLSLKDVDCLNIVDTFTQKEITLKLSQKSDFSAFILNTVSQSESGFDTVAQQISMIFSVEFKSELNMQINLGVSNV